MKTSKLDYHSWKITAMVGEKNQNGTQIPLNSSRFEQNSLELSTIIGEFFGNCTSKALQLE